MTHERHLERAALLQDIGLVLVSFLLAHVLRDRLASLVPGLKPAVPLRDYSRLLVAFVPAWAWEPSASASTGRAR